MIGDPVVTVEYVLGWMSDQGSGGIIAKTAENAVDVLQGRSSPVYKAVGDEKYGGLKVILRVERVLTPQELYDLDMGRLQVVIGLQKPQQVAKELPPRIEDKK